MINAVLSYYRPLYVTSIVYMLQNTEYKVSDYLKWYWRTTNFSRVMYRRTLVSTKAAQLLQAAIVFGVVTELALGISLLVVGWRGEFEAGIWFGAALIIGYPVIIAHLVVLPILMGKWLIVQPKERRMIKRARAIFAKHPAVKIAVAGSYGKTSMKEILLTVLKEGKKTAATPANKNVLSSHALFAEKLKGDEEVLVIEYGEGQPGDIKTFTELSRPDIGVITGIAPAHLDRYKTLDVAARDIFYISDYLKDKDVYVNEESPASLGYISKQNITYSQKGVDGWKITDVKIMPNGTSFKINKGKRLIRAKSKLVGAHQIGPLVAAVAIADKLGLSKVEIEKGVARTKAFEHRMQPRVLHGAWLIDDTYNGNIEGIRAGLDFLRSVEANRKIYVTPGLVDQGKENANVHNQVGKLIAQAKPDIVVLMNNSATPFILEGLGEDFKGELILEHDPLNFYNNLDVFLAAGDVILMQNDWTDNYA